MKPKLILALLLAVVAPLGAQAPMTAQDSAFHVLNRLAYGPTPGQIEQVARMGVMNWIEAQLADRGPEDRALAARERQFRILQYDRGELARIYGEAQRQRQQAQREMAARGTAPDSMERARAAAGPMREFRELFGGVQQLAVVRAALAERQLREVMADFWANHFNVFMAKGADRFLTPSYIEETIRPRALGRFEDLLVATAQSPAMLFYLDNAQSVAPGSTPPGPGLAGARGGRGGPGRPGMLGRRPGRIFFGGDMLRGDSMRLAFERRRPTGINENYARELLELHTLGVDGGYTQQDVVSVARIFTGWSIAPPQQGAEFRFNDWAHDRGEKTALGVRFPAGHGMDEGIRLLQLLASHHATMHFVGRKLCERFVSDDPPDGCIDDAAQAWHHSNGDIREVLRAIFRSPDFWSERAVRSKIKTPLEFVVSAVRALGGEPDSSPRLAQLVGRLGQPLYLQSAPTGYPETQEDWVNSGALLNRMNFAVALAVGRLPGVTVNLDAVTPPSTDAAALISAIDAKIFAGTLSENTKRVIREQLADVGDPVQARALAVGLALGGPEFQKQ